jgi:hypothetical protein
MWISKEVSDDLQLSDIDPDEISFSELEWPHHALEFVWEDPSLPNVITRRDVNRESLRRVVTTKAGLPFDAIGVVADNQNPHTDILMQAGSDMWASVHFSDASMDQFARGDQETLEITQPSSYGLDDDEKKLMQKMALLVYKTLLYSASEGCTPRETWEQPTKKQGGKAGFKNRPRTKRLVVEYLPKIVTARKMEAIEAQKNKAFLGRRGHWRVFRHPRFVHTLGTRKFIHPIPGPEGKYPKRMFKIIKRR